MFIGTVIDRNLVCDFGVLCDVRIHYCNTFDASPCHDELVPPSYNAVSKREKALLEIPGIFGARLTGTTLYLAIDKSVLWRDICEQVSEAMRSS